MLNDKQQKQYEDYVRLYKRAAATRQMKAHAFMYSPEEWKHEFQRMRAQLQNIGQTSISTNRAILAGQTFYGAEDTYQKINELFVKRREQIAAMPVAARTPGQQRFLEISSRGVSKSEIYKNIEVYENLLIDTYDTYREYYEARSPEDEML